jgi:hypothetical protein
MQESRFGYGTVHRHPSEVAIFRAMSVLDIELALI